MACKNSYVQLTMRTDGVYLKIYPPVDNGNGLTYDEVSRYLNQMKLTNYDVVALSNALKDVTEFREVKVASQKIQAVSEYASVLISEDKMTVTGRFYPPSEGGSVMGEREIINELVRVGVKFGAVKENIHNFLTQRQYCTDIVLAKGQPPEDGVDAVIKYMFKVDKTSKPKVFGDGSVDFHQLDIISHVNTGDLLAVLTPANLGTPGIDVLGRPIKQRRAVQRILKYGKNIRITDDKNEIYSMVSGHVILDHDKVIVSNIYEVQGDVDASTGDIDYDGNVSIKGNVITGFAVKAKGDIVVDGVVEGAKLYADGQIILKRGIQGMNKGSLEARGNIVAKFIENTRVSSGGYITSGAIMHSKVYAKGDIVVKGKKGFISGGEVRSGTLIAVVTAGSSMGTSTLLEVGIEPGVVDEFRAMEKDIAVQVKEKEKLEQIQTLFKRKVKQGEKISKDKIAMLQASMHNLDVVKANIKELSKKYEELKEEIDNLDGGKIIVDNVIYSGVKLIISNVTYFVRTECKFCQFVREGADIKMLPHG